MSRRQATAADHAPGLERAFGFVPREGALRIAGIDGELPSYLRGRYYVNGPARFNRGGLAYRHWLDGDGMVCTLRFHDAGVDGVARFVQSAKLAAENPAGRALFRAFGTAFPGDRLVRGVALASPVNVSVCPFGGRLLAFGEQGLPWELDPDSLETVGEHTFGGKLNPISPFSAHPHVDPESGELYNFGVSFSPTHPALHLYRFSAGGELLFRRRMPLDAPRSIHDFGLSQRYLVVYASPHLLDMGALQEGGTVMDALTWRPELGGRLLIAERESGEPAATIDLGSRYCLHFVNCFESDEGLMVDVVEMDRPVYDQYQPIPELFREAPLGRPVRLVVDPSEGRLAERRQLDYDRSPDFPSPDPAALGRRYDSFWMLGMSSAGQPGRKFFDELVHLDWRSPQPIGVYRAPSGSYLGGEPAFAPDPERPEERGAVICQRFDTEEGTSAFLVFDAFDVARGPLATLRLEDPLPLLFHSVFVPRSQEE